jgi:competence protein ComEC
MLDTILIASLLAILLAGILAITKKPDWKKWLALSVVFVLLVAALVSPIEQAQATSTQETATSQLEAHFIDVGQGDSLLIQYHNGQTMLIDAGTSSAGSTVVSYLHQQGINKIDYLVATHPHEDHIGGMTAVIKEFDIGKVYMPRVSHTSQTYENLLLAIQSKGLKITPAQSGTTIINQDGINASFVAPCSSDYDNLNNYSAVVKIQYSDTSFLLTGDAESESEQEMIASGANLKADVLKVGHHGSNSSTSQAFLTSVSPKYSVISCGEGNSYGHPHQEVLSRLASADVTTYRTDTNGTVIFASDGKTLTVETLKDSIEPRAPNERLSGRTRYLTSKAVAECFNSGQVDNVIIATGNGYADALSVSTLAGKLNAPILLVNQTTSKSQDDLDYISEHMTNGNVWIAGGTGVVDTTFESKLSSMGNSVERVEGRTRYDTCLAIAEKVNAPKGTPVFIASGDNFPDALSAASVAASKGYPIILTQKDKLPNGVESYLLKQQPSEVYIVGETGVISPTVESKIKSTLPGTTITRLGGQNRFDTSVAVYKKFFPNPSNIFIASGMDFPDALSASVLAAKYNAPMVLINPKVDYPPESTSNYLKTLDNPNITIIGGTGVVPVLLVNNIKDIYKTDDVHNFIGNVYTKKFHKPTCSSLPAEKNRVYFKTREEAISAGYEPCKICNP